MEKRQLLIILFWMHVSFLIAEVKDSVLTFEAAKELYPIVNKEIKVCHTPTPDFVEGMTTPVLSLNGNWMFSANCRNRLDGLLHVDMIWHPLQVPSEWYMEAFKITPNEWGTYYKEFNLPDDWNNKNILIRFGAVESECVIFLNGKYVGSHIGSMTQFEKDLTPWINYEDSNKLVVYVRSESLSSSISKISHYAKHQVGGILRSVDLIALPKVYIQDLYCNASLTDRLDNGILSLKIKLSDEKYKRVGIIIKEKGIEGLFHSGKEVYRNIGEITDNPILLKKPQLWHAESPFLYIVEVILFDGDKIVEVVKKQIGFRKIEIRGNILYVNNHPVKLRGVSRHDIRAYDGRAIKDTSLLRVDIEQLRNANCNFIRTSHYPPDSYMLDLCDRFGIFVENEAPVCWEASIDTYSRAKQIFYSFKSMLVRDRNHPCILLWSLGNESDWKPKFYNCIQLAKAMTPGIPIKFSHSETHGIIKNTDIGTKHYPGWKGLMAWENYYRPITFGEALHLNCYNTSENITDPGLRDMWGDYLKYFVDYIQNSPSIVGLGIWGANDEMFYPKGFSPCGYGPWGVVDGFRREKPEFWHMKMAYSPVILKSKNFAELGNETFVLLENRYNILNINSLDFYWQDGDIKGKTIVNIDAGKDGVLRIPHRMKSDTLLLMAKDKRGFLVSKWKIPRVYTAYYNIPALAKGKVKVVKTDSLYEITSKKVQYLFHRKRGELISIKKDGYKVISEPIRIYAIPHLKENEVIDYIPQQSDSAKVGFFSEPLNKWKFISESIQNNESGVVLVVRGMYDNNPVEFTYRIDSNDRLRVDYVLNISKIGNKIRQIGVGFNIPKDYTNLYWKRKSLWSTYPKNHIGRSEGFAKAFYQDVKLDYLSERKIPTHCFSEDGNQYGSNDFRSTKQGLIIGRLINDSNGNTISIESNGKQHLRAWVLPNCISFLVANYSDSGNEFYLNYDADRTKYLDTYLSEGGDFAGWIQLKF